MRVYENGVFMKKIIILISLFTKVHAEEIITCFPKNDFKFFKENKSIEGISEQEFSVLLSRAERAMSPLVKDLTGKKLIVNNKWSDPTVDANATRDENLNPVININGGLARHPQMTRDGLLLLICHEVGHHLGGAPKSFRGNTTVRGWSSAEGEADYFAVTKCLPRVFQDGLETKNLDFEIDTLNMKNAFNKCKDDQCARIILAGKAVSDVFASIKKGTNATNILINDTTVVDKTFYMHPNPQCRLDTYIAGARCDVSIEIPFDNNDPKIGACVANTIGARPTCWYRESDF
jgi:hypothetical protein